MSTKTVKPLAKNRACVCERCGYIWLPRGGREPKACPRCKSYQWNKPSTGRRNGNG